jgi:hypothetical protein
MNFNRAVHLIKKSISTLKLDLTDKVILTEVGSNEYGLLPIIAAMANAKLVFAWTRDSSYGKAEDIISKCTEYLKILNIESKVSFHNGIINISHLEQADIITNSGFLRPLDQNKLKHVKSGAVIPLMFEKWELRNDEIDIAFCKERNIKVAGTWENHPSIRVFENVGPLAIKMAFEAGYEVFDNNIIVWSDDDFGLEIEKSFLRLGANKVVKLNNLNDLLDNMHDVDFIFIADYHEQRNYFKQVFDLERMSKINSSFGIVHLYGNLSKSDLEKYNSITLHPYIDGFAHRMTYTLGYLGLKPIINLQTAGLKVGEYLVKNIESNLSQRFN